MDVHILMCEDQIEKVSCNGPKIYQLAEEYNGGPNEFGPYFAFTMELEDTELLLKNCAELVTETGGERPAPTKAH